VVKENKHTYYQIFKISIPILLGCLVIFFSYYYLHKKQIPYSPLETLLNQQANLTDSIALKKHLQYADSFYASISNKNSFDKALYYKYKRMYFSKIKTTNASIIFSYTDSLIFFLSETNSTDLKTIKLLEEAYQFKAMQCFFNKKYPEGFINIYKAIDLTKSVKDSCYQNENLFQIYSAIGNVKYGNQQFLSASTYFKKANDIEIICPNNFSYTYFQKTMLNNIGVCLERSELYDSALQYYREALLKIQNIKEQENIDKLSFNTAKGVLYGNIGGVLLEMNKTDSVEFYLNRSIEITKNTTDSSDARLTAIKLSNFYILKKRYTEAKKLLESIRISLANTPDPIADLRWTNSKYKYFDSTGLVDSALFYYKKYTTLNKKLSSKNQFAEDELIEQFNNRERETKISILEKENQLNKIYTLIPILFSVMLGIVVFLIWKNMLQVEQSKKQTDEINSKLNDTLLEVEKSNKNYSRILKLLAHDLRNPLSNMEGLLTYLMSNEIFSKEGEEITSLLKNSASDSLQMIDDILYLEFPDSPKRKIQFTEIDLSLIIKECVKLAQFKASEKKINLKLDIPVEATIIGNKQAIQRVILNLLQNAIKFSYPESIVGITIEKKEACVWISVSDTGIGVPKKEQEEIFEFFTKAFKNGTLNEKSNGIGLSLCKQIVQQHNGKIWVESDGIKGSTFYIEFQGLSQLKSG
jgi:signal transduction histidine kinase